MTREDELLVRGRWDGSELKSGLEGVSSTGAAAGAAIGAAGEKAAEGLDKASAAGKKMGDEVAAGGKEAAEGLTSVLGPSEKLEAQIKKTGNALSPRGMVDGAARMRIALEDIERQAKETGQAIGPELAAQMQRAETEINAAIARAGRLNETMEGVRKQAGLTADKMEFLAGALASPESAIQAMSKAGTGATKALGDLGLKAIVLNQGFGLVSGVVSAVSAAISAANKVIQEQLDKADAWALKMDRVRGEHEAAARAVGAAAKGTIAYGASIQETVRNLDIWTVSQGRNRPLLEQMAKDVGLTVPQSMTVFTTRLKEMDAVTSAALKQGEAAFRAWAVTNAGALKSAQDMARLTGEVLPPNIRKAIEAEEAWTKANRELKTSIDELNKAHEFSIEKSREVIQSLLDIAKARDESIRSNIREAESVQKSMAAYDAELASIQKNLEEKIRALNHEEVSDEEYHARKKALRDEAYRAEQEIWAKQAEASTKMNELRSKAIEADEKEAAAISRVLQQKNLDAAATAAYIDNLNKEAAAKGESEAVSDSLRQRLIEEAQARDIVSASAAESAAADSQATASIATHVEAVGRLADKYGDLSRAGREGMKAQLEVRKAIEESNDTFTDSEGKIHNMVQGVDLLTSALDRLGAGSDSGGASGAAAGPGVLGAP